MRRAVVGRRKTEISDSGEQTGWKKLKFRLFFARSLAFGHGCQHPVERGCQGERDEASCLDRGALCIPSPLSCGSAEAAFPSSQASLVPA